MKKTAWICCSLLFLTFSFFAGAAENPPSPAGEPMEEARDAVDPSGQAVLPGIDPDGLTLGSTNEAELAPSALDAGNGLGSAVQASCNQEDWIECISDCWGEFSECMGECVPPDFNGAGSFTACRNDCVADRRSCINGCHSSFPPIGC